jgi:integrase/recombinase XerD
LLDRLAAGDVSSFLARECSRRSVVGAMNLAANLRVLLRYLHVTGLIEMPLVWAVPKVADLPGRSLPKGLAPEAVAGMLASCDRESVIGRRDRAILLLLSRLGLRRGEVAGIVLDDIDWRASELLVRGKGHQQDRMPLPVDVGEAIVSYLRVRPDSEHRMLFLCGCAPFGPVSCACVTTIVQCSCQRAGLPRVGPHRLRHTAASEMLRAAPLACRSPPDQGESRRSAALRPHTLVEPPLACDPDRLRPSQRTAHRQSASTRSEAVVA